MTTHAHAIEALVAELGARQVRTDDSTLREFRDPFSPPTWDDYTASAVVMPESLEQVQAVVRIANEHKVPLWTHGQGRNNGYGGGAPRVKGSVTVSLRNMNKVLELDGELGYAVVEPGVTWSNLYDAIQAAGHKLMVSVTDLGWGSVVGNSLDNGITYMPYGADHMAPCGLEVVLASGEVLRTGMGAMPNNRSWHLYRRSLGPTLDPLFMQSNYGIVTKMGIWLMPEPECFLPFWVRVPKDADIGPLVDAVRRLRLDRTIEGVPCIYNTLLVASVMARRDKWFDGAGPVPDAIIDKIAAELGLGRWNMSAALYGDEQVVDHNFAKIKQALAHIPNVRIEGEKCPLARVKELPIPRDRIIGGYPNLDMYHITRWYGGEEGGHVDFSPVIPLTGTDALKVNRLMRGLVEQRANLDFFSASLAINARSAIQVSMILFDTKNEEQARKAYDTAKMLVREAAKEGYGEYRAHLDFMDLATSQFSFGDHAYRRFCESIKDAVDPNGILSPGRYGIWPRTSRPDR